MELRRRRRRATSPSIIGSMLRMTRSVSSLRMHTRIAVDAMIGSSPVTRAETGVTAATGSRASA